MTAADRLKHRAARAHGQGRDVQASPAMSVRREFNVRFPGGCADGKRTIWERCKDKIGSGFVHRIRHQPANRRIGSAASWSRAIAYDGRSGALQGACK